MLCFAYQRTEFIEQFLTITSLKKIKFEKKHLENLYGFGYMDGFSREILKTLYDEENFRSYIYISYPTLIHYQTSSITGEDLFLTMTTTRSIIDVEKSRKALNNLVDRLRQSDSFFPEVKKKCNIFIFKCKNSCHNFLFRLKNITILLSVSYTHLTLPTIYSV